MGLPPTISVSLNLTRPRLYSLCVTNNLSKFRVAEGDGRVGMIPHCLAPTCSTYCRIRSSFEGDRMVLKDIRAHTPYCTVIADLTRHQPTLISNPYRSGARYHLSELDHDLCRV